MAIFAPRAMVVSESTDRVSPLAADTDVDRPDSPRSLSARDVLDVLLNGEMVEVHGVMPWSSNYTFLVTVRHGEVRVLAVYKPARGEQPLWDFPHGSLALREVAAYLVSQELGWDFIPPTVLRDGEYGPGAIQLFVDADYGEHYFTLREQPVAVFPYVAAFDVITNNADRKAGHFLKATDGRVWAVDHGLTFHVEPKLRTVVWDFADQPLPAGILRDLRRLLQTLGDAEGQLVTHLVRLISPAEIAVFEQRVAQLVRTGRFPLPGPGRNVPFPPL
jgi:hypothetical protein